MKKRGISPLIATVILIGFVIAIAAVVMLWGRGFVEETAEKEGALAQAKLACQNVNFKIIESDGSYFIENTGTEVIDSFVVRKVGGDADTSLVNRLAPMGVSDSIPLNTGDELVPRIRPEGAGAPAIPCSNVAKTIL